MTPIKETVQEFLSRGGRVGADLLDVDWAQTPLGPMETWPRSLVTIVRVLLTSRFAMWMAWGPELTFLCNDAYRRDTLGKKYPWALGRPASEVWAEIWPDISPRIQTVTTTGESTWDEALLLILERSGFPEETYHTFSYSPLADDEGRVAGMLCVVSEESRRVIAQRRMMTLRELGTVAAGVRDEQEFLDATARVLAGNGRSLPFTAVYLFDEEGGARLAATSRVAPGHPVAPPRLAPGERAPIYPIAALAAGETAELDLTGDRFGEVPTGDWDVPPARALALAIPEPGQPTTYGFLVAAINPYVQLDTEYRAFLDLINQHLSSGLAAARSYEAERRRAEQLEELDRAKTAFFSNISHEFRTPLTLMIGPLEDALAGAGGLDGERVELVHRNALRLLKLVSALLDFSRAEAGRMQAEFRPTDVCRLTRELVSTFRAATQRAGLELVVSCGELSGTPYIDRDLWERIVLNLVSNAFKATLAGEIRVELADADGGLELSVSDTGTGIPVQELGQLFQRFHRVRSVARSYEGTGIGLALVKELAELHGGAVSVTSRIGKGSRFTVWIPYGTAHLPGEHVREEPIEPAASIASLFVEEALSWIGGRAEPLDGERVEPPPASPGDVQRPRVLIADDNPDLRRYLTSLLAARFEVETAADGDEALARVHAHAPDLLVSDVMMPGLDGYQLLERLRGEPATRELPIILLSARAGEESAIEGLAAGADDYLPKPFSGRELLARVTAHVELSRLRRQAAADVRAERRLLEQTLQQLPAGVMVAEAPSGRIVLGNEQAAEILGHPIDDRLALQGGGEFRILTPDGEPVPLERRSLTRAIRHGEVVDDEDLIYETPSGRRVNVRVSAGPIRDDAGEIAAGVLVFQDVSERLRSQRLLAAQRDILGSVAEGEPLTDTLQRITLCAEQLSEFRAQACILLRSPDGRRLVRGSAPGLPDAYADLIDGLEVGPAAGCCGTAAWRGERVIVGDIATDPLWDDMREQALGFGLRAGWSTPLFGDDGELVGTFALYYDRPQEPSPGDCRVIDLLASTAGVAIGRARDAESRARQLAELQSSLLPRELPEVPGLDAAVSFHPADRGLDVGGDFYDLFALPDGAWGFVIGDVCGHGAEAAAVTALTRHTTRVIARLTTSPAQVMSTVNEELRNSDHDRFCTAQYGRLEPAEDGFHLTLTCGGHPAPLVRRGDGSVEALRVHGPLVGVFADAEFPEVEVDLHSGDVLVLYTDGLIERNPRVAGERALGRLLESLAGDDVDALLSEVERRALGSPPARLPDDTAVLVLQVTGRGQSAAAGCDAAGMRAAA